MVFLLKNKKIENGKNFTATKEEKFGIIERKKEKVVENSMPQTKDPVLEKMRAAVSSKQITDDFPALIALLDSVDFWRKRAEDPALCRNFVQIVFNSENYGLSYEDFGDGFMFV